MDKQHLGRRAFTVGLAAGFSAVTLAGNAGQALADDKVIKIASSLPVSGGEASDGVPTQNGVQLAVEDANAKGVPGGFKFELDALDDAVQGVHNPAQGAQNMRTLISDPAVMGVVAAFNSNVAQAEIPLTNSAGLPQVSPSNTNPSLTKGPDAAKLRSKPTNNYFRVCTTDDHQGAAGAFYARKFGFKRVFIIDDNETYGKGLADVFDADFQKDGGTVVGHEHITKGQQDFTALLTKVASMKPDLVYFGGVTVTGGGLIRKQMSNVGLGKVAFMGGDGISDDEFLKVAGDEANGTYYTVAAPNPQKLPSAQAFIAAYKKRFGTDIGAYSANGYAAGMVLIDAVEKALKANGGKMPTRAEVLANVQKTDINTPIGKVAFDKNGDTTNGILSLYHIEGGKAIYVAQTSA